ncbi:PREDICTED: 7-deoxyloganetin glucosyltransferase [Theobroma cacao]|uniref:7-deoxyloganetin glucosyltransferase n=1 Tax=Theobroma cacao TaxID=3641 RepID=A0AB32VNK4_THECC|nr:PREDICTED: 7-deoxyloganetin glucosyltransferase [Theobroma cacao]
MGSIGASKPHAVCVPYPSQGHVTPMMHLAKLLHSKGFHITFVNTEFNYRRLVRSKGAEAVKGLPDFRFDAIPDGLPHSDRDATQDIPALCDSTRKNCLAPFLELIAKLNSSSEVPPVSCIISDGVMSFGIKAGEILGIPEFQFWTASVCGFMGYLQYSELAKRGIVPFKDGNFISDGTLDTPIDWIPGMSNMRLKDIPSFIRTTDPNDIMFDFLGSEAQNCLKSSAIIFNTFDELEQEVLEAIVAKFPSVYTIGPLTLLGRHVPQSQLRSARSSLWKEDTSCIEWLNKREPNSVVYVNYGSVTVMSDHHLKEFAWGLANSKHPFLWIIRPDVVMGESAILPEEFFEEIKDRGLITSWCPQDEVLCHPSVGVFLTHCGWNFTLESISGGVPVICWPFFAEQQTNCRYACTKWGIGREVNPDVKRDDVKALVKEMMEGDNGKQMRQKALEWRSKAEVATDIGGSSYNNFDRFINEALSIMDKNETF